MVAAWLEQGTAAAVVFALPWFARVAWIAVRELSEVGRRLRRVAVADVRLVAALYACVAAGWFVLSCAGTAPVGIHEPIVELTAVHFTYVGAAALKLAVAAASSARGVITERVAIAGTALTVIAPPFVALGFVTGNGIVQVGGAVLLTFGVWAIAAVQLRRAGQPGMNRISRALLAISGLAVWAPMVLAVAWAAGQHWNVPALSIADMIRTHGAGNSVGFIGAGLIAIHLDRSIGSDTWR